MSEGMKQRGNGKDQRIKDWVPLPERYVVVLVSSCDAGVMGRSLWLFLRQALGKNPHRRR